MQYFYYSETLMKDFGYFSVLCRQLDVRYKFNQGGKYLTAICNLVPKDYETNVFVYESFEQFKRTILSRASSLYDGKENYIDLYIDNNLYMPVFEDNKTDDEFKGEKNIVKAFLTEPRSNSTLIGALYIISRLRKVLFVKEDIKLPEYDFLKSAKSMLYYIIKLDPKYKD